MNGVKNVNKKKWERIKRGDITLFSKEGEVFACAVITMIFHNVNLAKELWGEDENHNTWENIYLVAEIKNTSIPYKTLNSILGYKEKKKIQGFSVLNDEQSEKLNSKFDLFSENIYEEVSEKDYIDIIEKLDEENDLDSGTRAKRRKEQRFLRDYLFKGKKEAVCGICGRKLPINMLITAHIKKRNECTKEEKLDYKNIVMPMCKCGCDDLYEKGYIYVQDEEIKVNTQKWITDDLKEELSKLEGRKCGHYNEEMEKYFKEHREKFGIK